MIVLEVEGGMGALGPMSEAERRLEVLQSIRTLGITQQEAAARAGVDVRTVRRWARRYELEGLAGLVDRSSRPAVSPSRLTDPIERRIVMSMREHPTWGARKLRARWILDGRQPVPALSTFARVKRRNDPFQAGNVVASAVALQRFQRDTVNDLWQVDATEWHPDGVEVGVIVDLIDDHSRFVVGAAAMANLSDEQATLLLSRCFQQHGAPRQLLSDNGAPFTGRPLRSVTGFERLAWRYRVHTIHGRPRHPQTQGKIERWHGTLKRELEVSRPATLEQLQADLARIVEAYNHQRPHQALDDVTPVMVWNEGWDRRAHPDRYPDPAVFQRRVSDNGKIAWCGWFVSIGRRYAGLTVTCTEDDAKLFIHHNGALIDAVSLDHPKGHIKRNRPGAGA
jgi:transposase InsO family protein